MNLLAKLVARATTPNASGVTATKVVSDVYPIVGVVLAVLAVLSNVQGVNIPVEYQAIIDAVVAGLTAWKSAESQQAVATAKAVAKVSSSRAKKAAK